MAVADATVTLTTDKSQRTIDWKNVWNWLVFIVVAAVVLLPLALLILGSFSLAKLPTEFSLDKLGFNNYVSVWTDPATYRLFYNTFVYVGIATAIGISVAALIAWLVERTNMPGKIWVYAGVPMTLAMPGIVQAMAWVLLLSPRSGFINKYFMDTFGLTFAPFDVYTLTGMAFVEGLRLVPTAFLMLVPLLRSMDPSLEEAAAVSGASPRSTVRKITMALMVPGLVAVTIFQAMTALEVFEVPGVLGMPVGLHVFATKIFLTLQSAELVPSYGKANALGILYLVIGVFFAWVYWRVIRRSERYTVVTGKGYRPRQVELGKWKWWALGFVAFFLFLSIGLPFLAMLYVSFVPYVQPPSFQAFSNFTLKHYEYIFTYPRFATTFWNTIYMVSVTATATTVVSFLISMVIVRSKFWGSRILDMLAFIPHTIPGIVLALAFAWLFLTMGTFGSIWTVAFAFTVGFIAYGTRAMNAAILQIHKDLEEAAGVSGASPWRVMLKVFFPLLMPAIIGLWIWVVLLSVRIAGVPLLLAEGPNNQVLATLIWTMWDEGSIEPVGAISTLMIVGIFGLVFLLRAVGFGGRMIQTR